MAQYRADMVFPVEDACREMSKPIVGSWRRLQRIRTYVNARPRVVWVCPGQPYQEVFDVMGDSNFAGSRRTRESTSGGATLLARHCTKARSKTLGAVANSSGEAHLYAVVRASCEARGAQTLLADADRTSYTRVYVETTTGKGICERTWLDRLRHMAANVLWMQEQQARDKPPSSRTTARRMSRI